RLRPMVVGLNHLGTARHSPNTRREAHTCIDTFDLPPRGPFRVKPPTVTSAVFVALGFKQTTETRSKRLKQYDIGSDVRILGGTSRQSFKILNPESCCLHSVRSAPPCLRGESCPIDQYDA